MPIKIPGLFKRSFRACPEQSRRDAEKANDALAPIGARLLPDECGARQGDDVMDGMYNYKSII